MSFGEWSIPVLGGRGNYLSFRNLPRNSIPLLSRLIRGDGEVVEEMVSRDRHRDINRQATAGDGQFFQQNTVGWNAPTK